MQYVISLCNNPRVYNCTLHDMPINYGEIYSPCMVSGLCIMMDLQNHVPRVDRLHVQQDVTNIDVDLTNEWPSYTSRDHFSFWDHEWRVHGSFKSPRVYLMQALQLN